MRRLIFILAIIVPSISVGQEDERKQELRAVRILKIEKIEVAGVARLQVFKGPLTGQFTNSSICNHFGLTPEQIVKIDRVYETYHQRAVEGLKNFDTPIEKLSFAAELLREMDEKVIDEILLTHQIEGIGGFTKTRDLLQDGIAKSLVSGSLGSENELTFDERVKIKYEIKQIELNYIKKVQAAQKEAIQSLIETVPASKRAAVRRKLKPILQGNVELHVTPPKSIFRKTGTVQEKIELKLIVR